MSVGYYRLSGGENEEILRAGDLAVTDLAEIRMALKVILLP